MLRVGGIVVFTRLIFEEKDVVPPEELGQVLAPYLYQYFPSNCDIEIVNSWLNLYNSGHAQEPHHLSLIHI